MADANHKRCTRCGLVKPPSDFNKDQISKTGLRSACRACSSKWGMGRSPKHDGPLTQARLRELVEYDPSTGSMTRLKQLGASQVGTPTLGCSAINPRTCLRKRVMSIDGKSYSVHRLAWLYMTGVWPKEEIDHIDGNGLNNRWQNLRAVSRRENGRNLPTPKSNTSGIVGVSWRESKKKWRAFITVSQEMLHLGYFTTLLDAVAARKRAERDFGFHPNHGRPSTWPGL